MRQTMTVQRMLMLAVLAAVLGLIGVGATPPVVPVARARPACSVLLGILGPAPCPRAAAPAPSAAPRTSPRAAVSATLGGNSSPAGVAVDAATNTVYVANSQQFNVTVLNGATNAIIATIPVGITPAGVAVNQTTNTVYVANNGGGSVSVINGATNAVSATIPVGSAPFGVAVDATTNTVYVTNPGSNTVSVINGATNLVTATVSVGDVGAAGVAADPTTHTVYVANQFGNTVSVIEGTSHLVTHTIVVGSFPLGVTVDHATNTVYVANNGGGSVSVISEATNAVTATLSVGGSPDSVAADPTTNTIYETNSAGSTVSVINGATNTVTATITVGSTPRGVAVDQATNTIYVANYSDSTVSVINCATNRVVATIPVGNNPWAAAVEQATGMVYVANSSNSVSVIAGLAPPGAPSLRGETAGDGSVTLQWQAPASDGGSPVTGYYVTSTPPTVGPVYVGGNDLTATVTGLTNGTQYFFTVTAVNAIGAGQPSGPAGSVTPQAPPDAGASRVAASPPSVAAGGSPPATADVTVTLLDDAGNPVSGTTVSLSQPAGNHSTIGAPSGPSDVNGVVSFCVSDATAEVVTYTATDTTDQPNVHLSQTASVAFTQACGGCQVAVSPTGERASPGGGSITAAVVVPAAGVPAAGLGRWRLGLHYDATLLTATACTSFDSACDFQSTPGVVEVSGTASPALSAGSAHTLATVTFRLSAQTGATSTLSTSADLLVDGARVPQAAGTLGLLVVVGQQGDVNLDKSVTATDALCVLRQVARLPETNACPQAAANQVMADVNADGSVTATDALCVLRLVAKLPPTAACPILPATGQPATANRAEGAGDRGVAHSVLSPQSSPGAGGVGNALSLSPSTVSAGKGKQTAVTVTADLGSGTLGAWTVDVTDDPKAVKVVSCAPQDGSICNAGYAAGVVRVSGASTSGLSGSQSLASLSFEGLGRGKAESGLMLRADTLTNAAGQALGNGP